MPGAFWWSAPTWRFRRPPSTRRPGLGPAPPAASRGLRRGGGTTLPGDVSRWLDERILVKLAAALPDSSLVVAGTNGKTTTAALLRHILEAEGRTVVANHTGANLVFGVTAALV